MNFFQKTPVALLLTALIVALCCVLGYSRAYENMEPVQQSSDSGEFRRAGESNLNYYLNWIDDEANYFTLETTDEIARRNLTLDKTYNSLLAMKTVNYLNGVAIKPFTQKIWEQLEMGGRDMLLVVDSDTQDWYLQYGSELGAYVDEESPLPDLFRVQMDSGFFTGESNLKVVALFDALDGWYEEHVPPVDAGNHYLSGDKENQGLTAAGVAMGILLVLLPHIWWIILLLVVLSIIDEVRLTRFAARYFSPEGTEKPFRPLLYWHHNRTRWYRKRLERERQDLEDDDYPRGGKGGPEGTQGAAGAGGTAGGPYKASGPKGASSMRPVLLLGQLWQLWKNTLGLCWETLRSLDLLLRRLRRGL